MGALDITGFAVDDQYVLEIAGDVDLFSALQLDDAVTTAPSGRIVLDLRGVTFIDTTGLAAILQAHRERTITLRAPSSYVRSLLQIGGLGSILTVEP